MTEKIKELAKQAKDYTKKYKKEMYSRGYYHDDLEEVYNKKFAELILNDCFNMVNKHMQYNNPNDSLLVISMKDHFGIELNEVKEKL